MDLLIVTVVKFIKCLMKNFIRGLRFGKLSLIVIRNASRLLDRCLNLFLYNFNALIATTASFILYLSILIKLINLNMIIRFSNNFFSKAFGYKTDRALRICHVFARPFKSLIHYTVVNGHFLGVDQGVIYVH